jgi:hypothetical protein
VAHCLFQWSGQERAVTYFYLPGADASPSIARPKAIRPVPSPKTPGCFPAPLKNPSSARLCFLLLPPPISSLHPSFRDRACSLPSDCPIRRISVLMEAAAGKISLVPQLDSKVMSSSVDLIPPTSPVVRRRTAFLAPRQKAYSTSVSESPASIEVIDHHPTSSASDPDAFKRSHRHSIPSHRLNNYLKFLNELAAKGSTTALVFSTAVISGSSSAPNLKEMPQPSDPGN